MSAEFQDKAKAERTRWTVLTLMALYLVLSVAVGVVRNQLQAAPAAATVATAQGGPTS
jgi:hypothetical protein